MDQWSTTLSFFITNIVINTNYLYNKYLIAIIAISEKERYEDYGK